MTGGKVQRLRRGASLEHVYTPADLHFGHIDSAFQSQEYIAQLIRQDPHDVQKIVTPPKSDDEKSSVDDGCWLYEQLRFVASRADTCPCTHNARTRRLAQDLTYPLITNLQLECNRDTCPEMKAGEWLYLCVAHGNAAGGHIQARILLCDLMPMNRTDVSRSVVRSIISYIHWTVQQHFSIRHASSPLGGLSVPQSSYRHFSSLARRLSRIFAHAYYHHRELFSQAEAESSLYARFLALSQQHELVPPELLVIPSESFELNSSNDRSRHTVDDHRDPGSPQSAIESGQEGTYLPNENERNMARRLFEEWTGNRGTDETNEVESEEQISDENVTEEYPIEDQSAVPDTDEHEGVPKAHQEPKELPSEPIAPGDSHGPHDEAPEPPVQATSVVTQEAESSPKTDGEKTEIQVPDREEDNDTTSPPSITVPTSVDPRPQSPVKESEANDAEIPRGTKSETDSETPEEGGEQSKDKDTAEN
ncbi:mps one binder kinase activator-like 4 [Rhizoctonia solani AG-1 IA]|uniref:Mps one binder kinase activator-like 4 n=1 Tax=Thanatephorus cucumeris (strain AG1-IA) TaxID=983506 RepID=L8WL20_THACA|nr:mps one binder kinase activator-like 4 [Rhizoctonia solani AG-1 IA]